MSEIDSEKARNIESINQPVTLASKLRGAYSAIVTPFSADAKTIDYQSIDLLLEQQIKAGITGLIIAGSTGEAATLSDVEFGALVRYVVERAEGKLVCFAGVNSSSTAKAVDLAIRATDAGAEGLLVVSPPYNKPTQLGIVKHFEAIYEATHKPIIAYNVPGRAVSCFTPQTIATLATEGLIVGLKESSGSVDNCLDFFATAPKLAIFSGDDSMNLAILAHGGVGVISVVSNLAPSNVARFCSLALSGDFEKARIIHFELLELVRALFIESNPIPVKAALWLKGLITSGTVRLPLTDAQPMTIARLEDLFALRAFE